MNKKNRDGDLDLTSEMLNNLALQLKREEQESQKVMLESERAFKLWWLENIFVLPVSEALGFFTFIVWALILIFFNYALFYT